MLLRKEPIPEAQEPSADIVRYAFAENALVLFRTQVLEGQDGQRDRAWSFEREEGAQGGGEDKGRAGAQGEDHPAAAAA